MLASMAQQFVTLLSLSAGIVWFSPWFLVILIAALIPAFLGESRFAMLSYSLLYRWTPERRELDYLRLLGASNLSAKEVKIFGLGSHLAERARVLFERYFAENRALALKRAATGTLLNLLPTAGYYGAYAWILYRALNGTLTIGDLTFLVGAFSRSRGPDRAALFELQQHRRAGSLHRGPLRLLQDRAGHRVQARCPCPRRAPYASGFEFRDVSFSYPGSERRVLDEVSLRFDAGERIALIGENGAGKTTLVKLLARLYDPSSGAILLDGVDLRDYRVEELRRRLA